MFHLHLENPRILLTLLQLIINAKSAVNITQYPKDSESTNWGRKKKKSKWRKKKKHPINNFKTMQDSVSNP